MFVLSKYSHCIFSFKKIHHLKKKLKSLGASSEEKKKHFFSPWAYLVLSFFLALLDLKTKGFVGSWVPQGSYRSVLPFFTMVHWWNTGISWSLFSGGKNLWILLLLSSVLCCGLIVFLFQASHKLLGLSLSLMIGGALGNLVDRYQHGAVFDFLYFHYKSWSFPAFNVADICLTCGWILCFVYYSLNKKNSQESCAEIKKKI